ncbi:ureidoglycolate lyase [Synechococcus sp. AH-707-M23]|nr:ureidoglycolate lyase [Synechococcus sp. AH-707-M23]
MTAATLTSLPLQNCRFERFGTAIIPVDDMTPHSDVDAHLKFEGADLRYYVMRLRHRPAVLASMTRHQRATQCLGSADAQPWWLAVAAPELLPEELCAASVQLVYVHPGEAVKLHQGTWHAGPFFHAPSALFYNLELGDTNLTDHNFQALTAPITLMLDPSLSSPSYKRSATDESQASH